MNAAIATISDGGKNTAAKIRSVYTDMLQSLQSYPGVLTDGVVADIDVDATPIKWTHFSNTPTTPNDLLESDLVNNLIKVKQPALYFLTFRFAGQWPTIEDLVFEAYVNGVANPITPIILTEAGLGAANPKNISVTDIAFIVNSAMIAAGPSGTHAVVELWASSSTGAFQVSQADVTFGMEYNPLSIRTVG